MANINPEHDARDYEERKRNNGTRPNVAPPRKTDEERMAELEAEVKANLTVLRRLNEGSGAADE